MELFAINCSHCSIIAVRQESRRTWPPTKETWWWVWKPFAHCLPVLGWPILRIYCFVLENLWFSKLHYFLDKYQQNLYSSGQPNLLYFVYHTPSSKHRQYFKVYPQIRTIVNFRFSAGTKWCRTMDVAKGLNLMPPYDFTQRFYEAGTAWIEVCFGRSCTSLTTREICAN